MSEQKLVYYYDNISSCCTHLSLLLKYHQSEDKVELKPISLTNHEQMTPEFLALNPKHTVPVLHDPNLDVVLTESTAIAQHLAKTLQWKGKYGLPDCPKQQALLLNAFASHPFNIRLPTAAIHRTFYAAFLGKKPELLDVDDMNKGLDAMKSTHFPHLEAILKKNNGWFTGEPTYYDVFAAFELLKYTTHRSGMSFYDYEDFPEIKSLIDRVMADVSDDAILEPSANFIMFARKALDDKFCLALQKKD